MRRVPRKKEAFQDKAGCCWQSPPRQHSGRFLEYLHRLLWSVYCRKCYFPSTCVSSLACLIPCFVQNLKIDPGAILGGRSHTYMGLSRQGEACTAPGRGMQDAGQSQPTNWSSFSTGHPQRGRKPLTIYRLLVFWTFWKGSSGRTVARGTLAGRWQLQGYDGHMFADRRTPLQEKSPGNRRELAGSEPGSSVFTCSLAWDPKPRLLTRLGNLNLVNNKHVPNSFLGKSLAQRLALL